MRLILARHGNTFEDGQTPYWLGGCDDVPLVKKGRAQAKAVAKYCRNFNVTLDAIYCAPLKRTREFSDIIAADLNMKNMPIIDNDLIEIDYGSWSGKSEDEIVRIFGKTVLDDWRQRGLWPKGANWDPPEQGVIFRVEDFAERITQSHGHNETILVVSSNGILRYFLTLIPGAFDKHAQRGTFRVDTGHICQLTHVSNKFKKNFWNVDPANVNPTAFEDEQESAQA